MPRKPERVLSFRVPEELFQALGEIAEREGAKRHDVAVSALEHFVERYKAKGLIKLVTPEDDA